MFSSICMHYVGCCFVVAVDVGVAFVFVLFDVIVGLLGLFLLLVFMTLFVADVILVVDFVVGIICNIYFAGSVGIDVVVDDGVDDDVMFWACCWVLFLLRLLLLLTLWVFIILLLLVL